ncbi:hypothetical protein FZEAL_8196 [Fusarium zealandicum]|uniref:Uncharacterized protein n=1 Tax=Fusarium zealandicum TaxID=1053134 RepID=A0A8H4UF89_9HYPO|nr:hypothetical protein FZEAL_8196 [Fusarium zealandicum]
MPLFQPKVEPLPSGIDLSSKTAIVTSATSGIGLEISRQLLTLKVSTLILAVRNIETGEEVKSAFVSGLAINTANPDAVVQVMKLDTGDYASTQAFVGTSKSRHNRLHLLILDAGIGKISHELAPTGHVKNMQVNYLSNVLLTLLPLPTLEATAREQGWLTLIMWTASRGLKRTSLAGKAPLRLGEGVLEHLTHPRRRGQGCACAVAGEETHGRLLEDVKVGDLVGLCNPAAPALIIIHLVHVSPASSCRASMNKAKQLVKPAASVSPLRMECGCFRKFKSVEALQQHIRDSRDTVHDLIRDKELDAAKGVIKSKSLAGFKANSQIQPVDVAVSSEGGYELLCSYNWVIKPQPTVYVPGIPNLTYSLLPWNFTKLTIVGEPPQWSPKPLPLRIAPDSGFHFIDQNSFRVPKHPFEVVFQAMGTMNPTKKFDGIDVLVNRNSLRHLLDFCHGRCGESFRINLYMVQNTLVIERCEKSARHMIRGSHRSGFGHNFEKAVTVAPTGMSDIAGHHRVLRYDLGGLNCAVRFEVDATWPLATDESRHQSDEGTGAASIGDLTKSLGGLKVEDPKPRYAKQKSTKTASVQVIARGTLTPHSQAAEIKSVRPNGAALGKMLPQLWFGRTPYLIRGYHVDGNFSQIKVDSIDKDLRGWETRESNQTALRKMAALIGQLRDAVKGSETKSGVAVCMRDRPLTLKVFATAQSKTPLPRALIEQFWEKP